MEIYVTLGLVCMWLITLYTSAPFRSWLSGGDAGSFRNRLVTLMTDIPKTSRGWSSGEPLGEVARIRWEECEQIAEAARQRGIIVKPEQVNRHMQVWRNWLQGRLQTSNLLKVTGAHRAERK